MQTHTSSLSFVGREDELAKISDLLALPDCRLLTLTGPGGIGKTRLAMQTASHAGSAFQEVYCIPLAPLSASDSLLPIIAHAVSFQFFESRDPVQQLLDHFGDTSVLLVLDNFEHLIESADLLSQILAGTPNVHILVTSRERLNLVEEWVLEVGGLLFPASEGETETDDYSAVRLFIQAANRAQVGFTLDARQRASVNRICRMVGGMPLALELAAAWVRALPCETIAGEIEHSLDVLETPARNMPARHRSIRAAFEPTWERLGNAEREVFKRLSVFRGGFTREAVEAVAGATRQTLSTLADRSLLHMDGTGRYSLHELLRQYAEEHLNLSGDAEAARDAHSAYFAWFLQGQWQPLRSHQQVIALNAIEVEFENVCAAWGHMVTTRKAAELSMSVYSLWLYADLRGRYLEALALFRQAEDSLRPIADDKPVDRAIGQILTRRAHLWVSLGKAAEALTFAEEGLAILHQVDNPEDIFWALDSVGMISQILGDMPTLKQIVGQMMEAAGFTDDPWLQARVLFRRAWCAMIAGHFEVARQIAQECLDILEAVGDLHQRAMVLGNQLAEIAIELGDYSEAKRRQDQGLQLLEQVGQISHIAIAHQRLGYIAVCTSDFPAAAYHYLHALNLLADHGGFIYHQLDTLLNIADFWAAQRENERAVQLLTVIQHHPDSLPRLREDADQKLCRLQAEMADDTFASAQACGLKLELKAAVDELITNLSQSPQSSARTLSQSFSNSLTTRELEILRLTADGLNSREIAKQLVLSVGTVRWYLKQIYDKLDAHSRSEAIARARALQLLI